MTLLGALIIVTLNTMSASFQWETLNSYDYFTKRISQNIFAGGWLTTRDISYLSEAGFKSIISTTRFDEGADEYNGMSGDYPSSMEEVELAKSLGMSAKFFSSELTVESVNAISAAIFSMPKPLYIHCHVGWGASLFAELHLYQSGSLDADEIYNSALTLGWDYQSNSDAVTLINAVTGLNSAVVAPSIEQTLSDGEDSYKSYYWSHRVSEADEMWYNAGQPLDTQVETIAAAGYASVVSFRSDGEATTRISSDPAEGPIDNHEFSDSSGNYNVTMERDAFAAAGVRFYNLPVTGDDAWSSATLAKYAPTLTEAASFGPVLAHCRVGHRSSAYVVAYLAQQKGECTPWALQQARKLGFSFDLSEDDESVMEFFESSLGC